ncbi:hypothetical protein [Sporomusa termitida]|nr:hypothetical protein [Sporomusa termitida]
MIAGAESNNLDSVNMSEEELEELLAELPNIIKELEALKTERT